MNSIHKYDKVFYNNKSYIVIQFLYKNIKVPVIVDDSIFNTLIKLNGSWLINPSGIVLFLYKQNNILFEIYLHDIVKKFTDGDNYLSKPIIHINRIGLDNRYENLIYDIPHKSICKNLRKKKRTITLPKYSNINVSSIPTFVWYLKKDSSHGDRFLVNINDTIWKSTSSSLVSLKYKLEETKKFLRLYRDSYPDLFYKYSMNGDYNENGLSMLKNFYDIIKPFNYNLKILKKNDKTDELLKQDTTNLSDVEIYLLNSVDPLNKNISYIKHCISNFK